VVVKDLPIFSNSMREAARRLSDETGEKVHPDTISSLCRVRGIPFTRGGMNARAYCLDRAAFEAVRRALIGDEVGAVA
jgi:hypothetical protein